MIGVEKIFSNKFFRIAKIIIFYFRMLINDRPDFLIEIIQIGDPNPTILIGVIAKDDFKQANVTICTDEETENVVTFDNRRAIMFKENLKLGDVRYIKAERIQ